MDFLDPRKRRAHSRRILLGYFLVAIALGLAATILIFLAYGYDIDRKNGGIIQNGLVVVSSRPTGAQVYVNGVLEESETNTRLVLPADNYTVEIKRAGYRDWKQSFTLEGGTVMRLQYPVLFPETLSTETVKTYTGLPSFQGQSLDNRWAALGQPGAPRNIDIIDLTRDEGADSLTTVTLPQTLMTTAGQKHTFEFIEWSTNSRYFLLKHTFTSGNEYLLIDRIQPAASINLNERFDASPTTLVLQHGRYDRYLVFSSSQATVARWELNGNTKTPLLAGVLAYDAIGDDTFLYTTALGVKTKGEVAVKLREGAQEYTVRQLPAGKRYMLDAARYEDILHIAAGTQSDGRIYVYKDPVPTLQDTTKTLVPVGVLRLDDPQAMAFAPEGRFVAAQSGNSFAVYDSETDRHRRSEIPGLSLEPQQVAEWADAYHLTVVDEGKTKFFDYDGNNLFELLSTQSGTRPLFAQDMIRMYAVSRTSTANRYALNRSELRVTQ